MAGSWSWCTRQQWAASLVPWQPSRGACWLVLDPLCACMTWARRSCCASLSTDGSCPLSVVVHGRICLSSLCISSMWQGSAGFSHALQSGVQHQTILNQSGLGLFWCSNFQCKALPAVPMLLLLLLGIFWLLHLLLCDHVAMLCYESVRLATGNRVCWVLLFLPATTNNEHCWQG